MIRRCLTISLVLFASLATAQEQIDKRDAAAGDGGGANLLLRVRVTQVAPGQKTVNIQWRHAGEGLGGAVTRGIFTTEDNQPFIPIAQWSKPLPLTQVAGKEGSWRFPTIVVSTALPDKKAAPIHDVSVDFEFAQNGKVVAIFTETAPKGATVGFAVPPYKEPHAFLASLAGLWEHARQRHEHLAHLFPEPAKMPKLFGIIGHLAGYGEGAGYGIRHSNPDIVKEECETLKLLGVNGLVGEKSVQLADAAGMGKDFRRVYWGGPGSGSPMGMLKKRGISAAEAEAQACPFDPELLKQIDERAIPSAIAEHHKIGAQESWGLWWDEIGVAAKAHIQTCPRCREHFVAYLKKQNVQPADVGAKSWDEVKPYAIWAEAGADKTAKPAPVSAGPTGLLYYFTFRFMTEATAQLFIDPAKKLKDANILLYAMQGPTPSWSGHSLDWHEFYDAGANTAFVFETSNRDPRVWQFESYLADIGRGICERHNIPMGVLVKPHRGAVEQRMLAVAARGAKVIEWYTYGPDYAKGDSFSQSPELLQQVAKAARFLGANEEYLYDAKPAVPARVAFCSPRSSEIWGKATDLSVTAFEDAKWVYIALRHANVPVDVLSEQQLAEGKLDRYQVIYVPGPNLRRDAAAQLKTWVENGGALWTDALGLSRDEANQPAYEELTGLKNRSLQTWGAVDPYKATDLKPFAQKDVPEGATLVSKPDSPTVSVGREIIAAPAGEQFTVRDKFSDGQSAILRHDLGKGEVRVVGYWAGLTYSSTVRNPDFWDMSVDFDRDNDIANTARRYVGLPVTLSNANANFKTMPVIEAIPLKAGDRRSIALINWTYQHPNQQSAEFSPATDLILELRDLGPIQSVRSAALGKLEPEPRDGGVYRVPLPKLNEIDLLTIE